MSPTCYSPVRHSQKGQAPSCRSTCMFKTRRQRSFWARIKLSMIVFIGLATNDFISNRPLLLFQGLHLPYPALCRILPLHWLCRPLDGCPCLFQPGYFRTRTIEPLAVLQNRFRFCIFCSNCHVTAAFFPFPYISSCSWACPRTSGTGSLILYATF